MSPAVPGGGGVTDLTMQLNLSLSFSEGEERSANFKLRKIYGNLGACCVKPPLIGICNLLYTRRRRERGVRKRKAVKKTRSFLK